MQERHFANADLEQNVRIIANDLRNIGDAPPKAQRIEGLYCGAGQRRNRAVCWLSIGDKRRLPIPFPPRCAGGEIQGAIFDCMCAIAAEGWTFCNLRLCGHMVGPSGKNGINRNIRNGRKSLTRA